jgi:hypothetical protein
VAALVSALLWSTPLIASDYAISGESNTIFRPRTAINKKTIFPAYEYLRLSLDDTRKDGTGLSFYLGAWGRADLADKSSSNSTDGDFQYAYLTYRAPKNNTVATVGRQFISEGVASERIDGVYVRNDFVYGIGASAFLGNSVITEPTKILPGGGIVYGTRISQTDKKYYTVGLSAIKSEYDNSSSYREEEGLDLWIRPLDKVELIGRSSYNSITSGWMENSYSVSYSPLKDLSLGADFSHINFKDYLASVTTSALSLVNPIWKSNEKQTAIGTNAAYTVNKDLTVAADFKFFSYDQSGDASYFGVKATYAMPDSLLFGCGLHRMEGYVERLRYVEMRAFASKKMGQTDLALDAVATNFDKMINGIRNGLTITGALGHEINRKLKLGADLEIARNPDFDREARVLLKATYTFDTTVPTEGGTKSEK